MGYFLSGMGGNFIGAIADEACESFVGASAACWGLISLYWGDVILEAIGRTPHQRSFSSILVALTVTLLQLCVTFAMGSSAITLLILPTVVIEVLEAGVPMFALVVVIILFISMPVSFYAVIGDPVCTF